MYWHAIFHVRVVPYINILGCISISGWQLYILSVYTALFRGYLHSLQLALNIIIKKKNWKITTFIKRVQSDIVFTLQIPTSEILWCGSSFSVNWYFITHRVGWEQFYFTKSLLLNSWCLLEIFVGIHFWSTIFGVPFLEYHFWSTIINCP